MNRRFWLKSAAFAATILGVAGAAGCFTLRGRTGADITQASGRRLERMLASPHFKDGFFHNLEPVTVMTRKRSSWLSMAAFFLEDDTGQKPDKALPVIHDDYHHLPEGSMVWFGHSSFLLRKDGLTIAIDPVFHDASPVPGFFKP
ncbi:MAG TPA: hypothetical protein DCW60_02225, partial [Sutterella sp.]|nr:hypothetical protein [Sutterella sp.]